jgi:diguanylate cyclase (GGDEF)-like protein/PAS domain S-box-containing protein
MDFNTIRTTASIRPWRNVFLFLIWILAFNVWAEENIVLQLKWQHAYQFAGYYAAHALGYYREEGLNVKVHEGGSRIDYVNEVLSGHAQYATGSTGILLDRNNGKQLVALAVIFQHSPDTLLVTKHSGITSPQQLVGKRVMVDQVSTPAITPMLLNETGSLNRFNLLKQTNDLKSLIDGKIDAIAGYSTNQPYYFQEKNLPVVQFNPIQYGIDFYGDNLFSTEQEIKNHPERVKAFVRASLKGWEYAMSHPDEMIPIIQQYGSTRSTAHLRFEYQALHDLILPELVQLGHMHEGRWRHIADTYVRLGKLKRDYSLDGFLYDPEPVITLKEFQSYVLAIIVLGALILIFMLLRYNRKLKHEITERNQIEKSLLESESRLYSIFDAAQDGILLTDVESKTFTDANPAICKMLGYTREQLMKLGIADIHPKANLPEIYNIFERKACGEFIDAHNIPVLRKDDTLFYADINTAFLIIQGRRYLAGFFRDITERMAAAEEIKNLAFYDPLTRLANRRLLIDRLNHAIATSSRTGKNGALLFLDLDHFKILNDTQGHELGDLLLQQVGKRLLTCVREGDTVARIGGDEFVVMLEELSEQSIIAGTQADLIGNKILEALALPFVLDKYEYRNTTSIGATLFDNHFQTAEELLKQADIAMYHSKKSGRNSLHFFDPYMQVNINARALLERSLRHALDKNQFRLYYQPQVNEDGHIHGAESLVRWVHPEYGMKYPASFIPLAEENGIINPLGHWILETACAQLLAWQQVKTCRKLTLAVNVSAKQFHQLSFIEQIKKMIQHSSIDPALLKLELTESLLVEDIDWVIATMNELNEIGIQFSLDDFGTGYSSLQYLKRLPLNQLKIDQSFVQDIATESGDEAIVSTIIVLARNLGINVIAEGVETEQQRQCLLEKGCNNFQGYLFGKATPIDQFETLIKISNKYH